MPNVTSQLLLRAHPALAPTHSAFPGCCRCRPWCFSLLPLLFTGATNKHHPASVWGLAVLPSPVLGARRGLAGGGGHPVILIYSVRASDGHAGQECDLEVAFLPRL